nr:MAG TPA: hypothetical protein [Caudoviricetes sp.]
MSVFHFTFVPDAPCPTSGDGRHGCFLKLCSTNKTSTIWKDSCYIPLNTLQSRR